MGVECQHPFGRARMKYVSRMSVLQRVPHAPLLRVRFLSPAGLLLVANDLRTKCIRILYQYLTLPLTCAMVLYVRRPQFE
jgi:hypothetical protein